MELKEGKAIEWIDTHSHLYLKQFDGDREAVVRNCLEVGVNRVLLPDIEQSTSASLWRMTQDFPDFAMPMTGLHPCSVTSTWKKEMDHIHRQLKERTFVAIGETGLDFYWDKTHAAEQYDAFIYQIELARELGVPVVIHSRDSLDETIGVMERHGKSEVTPVFHCFNGSLDQAKRIVDIGGIVGLGGVITFKNVDMDATLRWLPESSIVLETDSPYLAPVPYRGKRNESSYLIHVGRYLATVRNQDVHAVADFTTRNAVRVFDLNG